MSKKGETQIDWIISLFIFMLYLAWFFVYVAPTTRVPPNYDTLLASVTLKIKTNASWTVDSVPLIIESNISGVEPVFVDFPLAWNSSSFSQKNSYPFLLDERRLVLIANLSAGKSVIPFVHSDQNYSSFSDLVSSTSTYASSSNFRADFESSLLSGISLDSKVLVSPINITVNQLGVDVSNSSYSGSIIPRYKLKGGIFNHTSYVYGKRIYNFISINNPRDVGQNITLIVRFENLSFYRTERISGTSNSSCIDDYGNYFDAFDSSSGVSLIIHVPANLSICTSNQTIIVKAYFTLQNDTQYDLIAHAEPSNSTPAYVSPYFSRFGIVEGISGISEDALQQLNISSHAKLRSFFNYPASREFSFLVLNSSVELYKHEPKLPDKVSDVFVKESNIQILDKYGNFQTYTLRVKGW